MQKLMQAFIERITAGKVFSDSDERYIYLTMMFSIIFAGIMHAFLICAMQIIGVNLFVVVNIVSVLIYGSILVLVRIRRTYQLAGIIITCEVILYTVFASIYLGENCYFFLYFFLILLIQLNISYAKPSVRVISSVIIFIALIAVVVVEFYAEPFYKFQDEVGIMILSISNCVLCFFGIFLQLLAISIIRKDNAERVRKYEEWAHTDSLTGIYNRWYADGFIANFSEKREEICWCVAMLDIDDFKKVNDTMGHPAGDEVLKSLANILKNSFRKTDVLFRWGGEEFLLFLSNVELETAVQILDVVRKRICDTPVCIGDAKINYTVTIGVVEVDWEDVRGSISVSDERLYFGKQNGKNQVVGMLAEEQIDMFEKAGL